MRFHSLCVLGLGYIGLPTASTFATNGMQVIGVDVNRRIVDVLRKGELHIQEPGLRGLVQAAFGSGNLRVAEQAEPADAFLITVPTPIQADKRADLSAVRAAAQAIAPHLRKGNLVVLESTSPPRTTVDVVAPLLADSGLQPGRDFWLAYSPERVLPGQILRELIENARVIGGINRPSAEAGRELYSAFVRGEIVLTDATTAEMVKLMETLPRRQHRRGMSSLRWRSGPASMSGGHRPGQPAPSRTCRRSASAAIASASTHGSWSSRRPNRRT
jgi:UDP-N-acetyl-D-mannosaminuronic acid dehydrogenase